MKNWLAISVLSLLVQTNRAVAQSSRQEYYQIRVYHFEDSLQQATIEEFISASFLPQLHRKGYAKIGVFAPLANDTAKDKKIYTIIPARKLDQVVDVPDEDISLSLAYAGLADNRVPFTRMELILLKAFPMAPVMQTPDLKTARTDHVYELRSYESATPALHRNKVKMFNEGGEIELFRKLGFNAVFYASVISGSAMPNLMYMTSFESMEERTAHWKSFVDAPEWKKLSALPEYQRNVSHIDVILMKALPCSDY